MSRFKFRTQLVIYFFITIIFVVVSMFVSLFASLGWTIIGAFWNFGWRTTALPGFWKTIL